MERIIVCIFETGLRINKYFEEKGSHGMPLPILDTTLGNDTIEKSIFRDER